MSPSFLPSFPSVARSLQLLAFGCFLLAVSHSTSASVVTLGESFTMKEELGRTWTNDLVHYPIKSAAGATQPNGVQLLKEGREVVPSQLTDVKLHPDGSLASANLWFLASLSPNSNVTFTVQAGGEGITPAGSATDLYIQQEQGSLVLGSKLLALRLATGNEQFAQPVPVDKIPAPLQSVRLASGIWTGRGWFETKLLCTEYQSLIAEDGPVFKTVRIRYTFAKPEGWNREGDLFYEMTVQLVTGQPVASFTEDFNLGDPAIYQPMTFASEKEELMWGWWSWKPQQAPDNFIFSFVSGGKFQPTHARYLAHTSTDPARGVTDGTSSYRETEYALQFEKDRLELKVNARSAHQPDQGLYYAMFNKADPQSDILALIPVRSPNWRNPNILPNSPAFIKQTTDASDFRISAGPGDLYVRAPLHLGHREWLLAVLRNPDVITETKDFTTLARTSKQFSTYRLDVVKDWVLDWPEHASPKDPQAFTGDAAREYADLLGKFNESIRIALDWPNIAERTGINSWGPNFADQSERAFLLLQSGKLTDAERVALRARMAFLFNILWSGEILPPRVAGYGWGSLNMPVNLNFARGKASVVMRKLGYPGVEARITAAAKFFKYQIENSFSPDGSPESNPHYMGILADVIVTASPLLKEAGLMNNIKESFPNYYNFAQFMVDMVQPVDIRFGKRSLSTEGDAYWDATKIPAQVAPVFKESDPELYQNLLWAGNASDVAPKVLKSVAYPGYGAFFRNHYNTPEESYLAIRMGNFTIDHGHYDAGSVIWYARGVPLAMDFATMYTPHTPGSWLHGSLTYDHTEHKTPVPCPGKESPNCFYHGKAWLEHKIEPNTLLEARASLQETNLASLYGTQVAFATQPGADYLVGEAERERFALVPYFQEKDGLPVPLQANTELTQTNLKHPFTWTRQFVYVKDRKADGPNYLLITDDLTGNQELEPAFNFWALASDLKEVGKRQFYFTGQHGIDMDAFVLTPTEGKVQFGEWGHTQKFLVGEPGLEERQKLLRVYQKRGGEGFQVLLYPRKANEPQPKVESLEGGKLVKLTLPDQTHWVLASKENVTVKDGDITLFGTAGVVKQWKDGKTELTLLAGGKLSAGAQTLESQSPATETK